MEFEGPYFANQIVTVQNGDVDKKVVRVKPRGTVQFVNKDKINYTVRLQLNGQTAHADVDLLLLALGENTLVADPDIIKGECEYELVKTDLDDLASDEEVAAPPEAAEAMEGSYTPSQPRTLSAGKGGGGTIIIGA
jgi:hypothetical protein